MSAIASLRHQFKIHLSAVRAQSSISYNETMFGEWWACSVFVEFVGVRAVAKQSISCVIVWCKQMDEWHLTTVHNFTPKPKPKQTFQHFSIRFVPFFSLIGWASVLQSKPVWRLSTAVNVNVAMQHFQRSNSLHVGDDDSPWTGQMQIWKIFTATKWTKSCNHKKCAQNTNIWINVVCFLFRRNAEWK